jgi:hypothetical protein
MVSSDSVPPLGSVPEDSLAEVVARLLREGSFFYGVHPLTVAAVFGTDPLLAAQTTDVGLLRPWR